MEAITVDYFAHDAERLISVPGGSPRLIMGRLSITATALHTKAHRPPERSSDLLGVMAGTRISLCKVEVAS